MPARRMRCGSAQALFQMCAAWPFALPTTNTNSIPPAQPCSVAHRARGQFANAPRKTDPRSAAAAKGIKDYNLKALEFAKVNSDTALEYAQQLMSAKTPSEMLELWITHARKQFEVLTEQTKQLSMLGQRVVTETAEPLTRGTTKAFNQAA